MQCVPNYCGGCNRRWYNLAGQQVNCAMSTDIPTVDTNQGNTNMNTDSTNNVPNTYYK